MNKKQLWSFSHLVFSLYQNISWLFSWHWCGYWYWYICMYNDKESWSVIYWSVVMDKCCRIFGACVTLLAVKWIEKYIYELPEIRVAYSMLQSATTARISSWYEEISSCECSTSTVLRWREVREGRGVSASPAVNLTGRHCCCYYCYYYYLLAIRDRS